MITATRLPAASYRANTHSFLSTTYIFFQFRHTRTLDRDPSTRVSESQNVLIFCLSAMALYSSLFTKMAERNIHVITQKQ